MNATVEKFFKIYLIMITNKLEAFIQILQTLIYIISTLYAPTENLNNFHHSQ